ncbi:MAG: TerB family tellurite resistance protein [Fulvivirga sp.]|uniref:TerB family tellurite resistance protein n=1 Tax=Fulvivirga sp. TaxID=1931237 RepID=UPI0032ED369C
MKSISVNTKLYYLLTYADGELHEKEKEMGEKMLWHEAMSKENFNDQIIALEKESKEAIFTDCMKELKSFDQNDQINCLAWMCLIANADGFMDKNEWDLIYRIYHKHLGLTLSDITARQKELHKFIMQYRDIPEASATLAKRPEPEVKQARFNPEKTDKPKLSFPM